MILYIDTSSSYLYAAIVSDNEVKEEIKQEYGHELSKVALPEIVTMFESSNITPQDITKIIVVNGPGSFTGIRIGITIAKVYAWSLKVPITTVTSLEAMAASSEKDLVRVPIIDARRGFCYAAIFDENDKAVLEPTYITYEKLEEKLKNISRYKIISNDQEKLPIKAEVMESYDPNFIEIVKEFKNKNEINPHAVNPNYLKLTEAEESRL